MSTPKYQRRKVTVNPIFSVPPGIIDVEIEDNTGLVEQYPRTVSSNPTANLVPISTVTKPGSSAPVTSGTNPWGNAKLVSQKPVINSDGSLVVEVTFELADWAGDYDVRISRN